MKLRTLITLLQCLLITDAQRFLGSTRCRTPDNRRGRCLLIYRCRPMLDALERFPKPYSSKVREYLRSFQCDFNDQNLKVCCPSGPIYLDIDTEIESSPQPPDVSRHRNLRLLPKDCGYLDSTNRIVNGKKTGLYEFPWMALLAYQTRNGPTFKCGGTVINSKYILTAAHCVTNLKLNLIGVRVGEHNTKTQEDCELDDFHEEVCAPPYQDLAIEKILPHTKYNKDNNLSNDIALLRVTRINLSLENSKPVCLPLDENRNYNFTGRNVVVTGWGATETGLPSPELLRVNLPVVPLKECQELYKGVAVLDERQLCAGGKSNKDSCSGDSGGPLHAIGSLHGQYRYIQQGIVSFGPRECGNQRLPGVYTRVAYFMDWILDNIEP